jgi:starch synthase
MRVLQIAAECYPAAKVGGLADVVGALPKYLHRAGVKTAVVMPKYDTKWLLRQDFREVWRGEVRLGDTLIPFAVEWCAASMDLGFDLFVANIPTFFAREGVYSYPDDVERWLVFQQAALRWAEQWKPDVLHCHDHHTGLIPFMVQFCPEYAALARVPTIFTIHNGQYHGAFSWSKAQLLPWFRTEAVGQLDWGNTINPMACGIKCAWQVTTVSPGYLGEMQRGASGGLETLMRQEAYKSRGILNGIDAEVWNPMTDEMLPYLFNGEDVSAYKTANKQFLCKKFGLRNDLPLITFIGRLVHEKGSDMLVPLISQFLSSGGQASFVILGSGDKQVETQLAHIRNQYSGYIGTFIGYDEPLSHQLYAGSDFLLMPSRVEPCGLNQLYAQRYGTVPIVCAVGGLRDSVTDLTANALGSGIRFEHFDQHEAHHALWRAWHVFRNPDYLDRLRRQMMRINHSWEQAAQNYVAMYQQF